MTEDRKDSTARPAFAAIVVAAGKGLRAGQELPKQFVNWRGKPVLRHSVERLLDCGADRVVIAIPENGEELAAKALAGLESVHFVTGGKTRQSSVRIALEYLANEAPENVLIHDAARPLIPEDVIGRLLDALSSGFEGAIPVLSVVDSLAVDDNGTMGGSANREELRRVQTPQAFHFEAIHAAHPTWHGEPSAGDDAQVLANAGGKVVFVEGDEALKKLTLSEDFLDNMPQIRTGMGFDVHRLVSGEELWLGGIQIDHEKGLAGHSDADVALHAIVDALLGAIAAGDIGDHFPPSEERWKGAASSAFVEHAATLVSSAGFEIANVDLTIICEAPKIGPHRLAMRETIAGLLGVDITRVSVKATTTERLGLTGRGEGIAAQAVATISRGY